MLRILNLLLLISFATPVMAAVGMFESYPILEAVLKQGGALSTETKTWMEKWRGTNLEESIYSFPELSGSTSVMVKVQRNDPTNSKNFVALGSFLARNDSGNPYIELAYFNLSALIGRDYLFRPAVRYEMGPRASNAFKDLMDRANLSGARAENRKRLLAMIATGKPLNGILKAKKTATEFTYEEIGTGSPSSSHAVIKALQAGNPEPRPGTMLKLTSGYTGDLYELAREYSVLMCFDVIFQQWDRYSGGNVSIQKDASGRAHFYFSDNGGADLNESTTWVKKNLGWFSRYDREVIASLRELSNFLENPSAGYFGYTNAEAFVVDLGLYSELAPASYVARMKRNLKMLLEQVAVNEAKYGQAAYFE